METTTIPVFLCRGSRWLVIEEGTDQSHQHFCCAVSACKGQLHQSSTSSTLRQDSSYCAIWLAWGASAWLVWFCYTCQTYYLWFFLKHINCIFPQKQVCNLPTSHGGQDTNVLHMGIQIGFQVLYSHFCSKICVLSPCWQAVMLLQRKSGWEPKTTITASHTQSAVDCVRPLGNGNHNPKAQWGNPKGMPLISTHLLHFTKDASLLLSSSLSTLHHQLCLDAWC